MARYAFFSITFRRGGAKAADVSIQEWMNLRAGEGYRFLEHKQGITETRNIEGPIIVVTVVMEKSDI